MDAACKKFWTPACIVNVYPMCGRQIGITHLEEPPVTGYLLWAEQSHNPRTSNILPAPHLHPSERSTAFIRTADNKGRGTGEDLPWFKKKNHHKVVHAVSGTCSRFALLTTDPKRVNRVGVTKQQRKRCNRERFGTKAKKRSVSYAK
ncbi:uncharacterized protein ACDP82_005087 isoform 1-T1 [Pangshura tecta]